jgi:hypothetical protein
MMLIQESACPCVATEEYCLPPRHTRPIVSHVFAVICPTLPFPHCAHATPTSAPVVLTSQASSSSTLAVLTSLPLRPHHCARATPTYSAQPCHLCTASHLPEHTVIHSILSSPTTSSFLSGTRSTSPRLLSHVHPNLTVIYLGRPLFSQPL